MKAEKQLRKLLELHYNIGDLLTCKKIESGTINRSYSIQTLSAGVSKKFLLRRYIASRNKEEIEFEHALLDHLSQKKFPSAATIKTIEGKAYVVLPDGNDTGENNIYALFDFLPGENKYVWDNPGCTEKEIIHSANTLAQYHSTVDKW
ncbi:MAG: phosphotransferase, partial [Proteobacteria bacterium]|nr:phosphotransferase [Pseudomonadota bacterium]